MKKQKIGFQNVSLDSYTYGLLNELAEATKLTKAAYLRALIRNEAAKRQGPEPEMVNKRGEWMPVSELNPIERLATRGANKIGVTIDIVDVEKLKKDITNLIVSHLNVEPKNTEELV